MKIELTDNELVLLDGKVSGEVQEEVDRAKARVDAVEAYSDHADITPTLAAFIADVVHEARTQGRLVANHVRIRSCRLHDEYYGFVKYKSGPNQGRPNYKRPIAKPGREFARRFVTVEGHVTLGGCNECIEKALPALREALIGVPAQLPDLLVTEGAPRFTRYDDRECLECGWTGHEGQMGRLPAILGGDYPGKCPSCGAEKLPFGPQKFKTLDSFTVVRADQ